MRTDLAILGIEIETSHMQTPDVEGTILRNADSRVRMKRATLYVGANLSTGPEAIRGTIMADNEHHVCWKTGRASLRLPPWLAPPFLVISIILRLLQKLAPLPRVTKRPLLGTLHQ